VGFLAAGKKPGLNPKMTVGFSPPWAAAAANRLPFFLVDHNFIQL
jgi:tRNA A37 threonylcarbamoyltransferase TsaD